MGSRIFLTVSFLLLVDITWPVFHRYHLSWLHNPNPNL